MRGTQTFGGGSAVNTSYNNSTSGLSATNVQDAIDQIDGWVDYTAAVTQNIKAATIVATPNSSGEITIPFSTLGLTSRPDVVVITGGNDNARLYTYLFDRSTSEIIINVYRNGQPVTGPCRMNIMVYPTYKV